MPSKNNIPSLQRKTESDLIKDTNLPRKNEQCQEDSDITEERKETNPKPNKNFPTLSETVMNMFIEGKTHISEIEEGKSDTEEFRLELIQNPNKPTAIVKPCQKIDIEDLITKTKEDPIKISNPKQLVTKKCVAAVMAAWSIT